MLETWNLVRKCTHTHVVSENVRFSTKTCTILLMSAFILQRNQLFCQKLYIYSNKWHDSCVRDFLVLFSVFVRKRLLLLKMYVFTDHASGIQSLDCSKLAINWKNDNDITICWHEVILNFLTLSWFSFQV